jgi:hypothetical protein
MTRLFTACVVLKWRPGVQQPAAALFVRLFADGSRPRHSLYQRIF